MKKLLSLTINTQGHETIISGQGKKSKTYRGLKSQIAHNTRTEKMDANYLVRPDQTKNNIHMIIKSNLDKTLENKISKMEEDYKNHYNRKMPKNTKPFINGLITFSSSMLEDIEIYGKKKMADTILDFLKEEYGVNNIISVDLHLDETTPHFHFQVLNYDFKNHKTHSAILEKRLRDKNNPDRKNITQDNLAEYLQLHIQGFDYQRGEITSTKKYNDKKKAQAEYLEKQKQQIEEQQHKIQELEKREQQHIQEINELKNQKSELEKQVDNLDNEVQQIFHKYENDINDLVKELTELNEEMQIKDFYKKIVRYLKNDNQKKLIALIKKMNRKVAGAKRKGRSI